MGSEWRLSKMNRVSIAKGIQDAMPIMLAYFPIAITFGVISTSHGIPWLITLMISAWIYAGGAQFMLVGLAIAGTSPSSTVVTVLLVNLRHFLYGTTLGPAFAKWSEPKKWLSAFGLTDEVFAVTSSRVHEKPLTPAYQIPFVFGCYASWLAGTAVGAGIGQAVPIPISDILGFALPALFLALLLIGKRSRSHIIAASCGAVLSLSANLLHWGNMGIGIVIGAMGGATVGLYLQRRIRPLEPLTSDTSKIRDR